MLSNEVANSTMLHLISLPSERDSNGLIIDEILLMTCCKKFNTQIDEVLQLKKFSNDNYDV